MPDQTKIAEQEFQHVPVLAHEVLHSVASLPETVLNEGLLIDTTLGGGGHSALLLEAIPDLHLIGLDQDPTARLAATKKLSQFGSRVKIISTNFADFIPSVKGSIVLADLGVSSAQLDVANRGFSFRLNGPIDMRMNPNQQLSLL